jgi:hypothetical protein
MMIGGHRYHQNLEANMEYNTQQSDSASELPVVLNRWEDVLALLPSELEALARSCGAFLRRRRVCGVSDLIWLVLQYAVSDMVLIELAVWYSIVIKQDISDVAVLKRLRHCRKFVGSVIVQLLQQRRIRLCQRPGLRLRLIDATVVSQPGSHGTDYRIHISFDLGNLCLDGVEVTSGEGGESLARFPAQTGDVYVGDRGYAYARSLGHVLAAASNFAVRINWQNLPLQDQIGQRLDIIAWLKRTFGEAGGVDRETEVQLPTPQGIFPARLLARALPQEAADRARQRAYKAAKKKGRTPSESTLVAAGYVLVLTNLPAEEWSAEQVLDLYRIRWQVEMLIKRMKSELHLDHLRARDPELAQTYLLGKLLAIVLLDMLTEDVTQSVPDWLTSLDQPISPWRLAKVIWRLLHSILLGPVTWGELRDKLREMRRLLCVSRRKRRQQLAEARAQFTSLSVC